MFWYYKIITGDDVCWNAAVIITPDTPGFYWKKMTSENSESGPSSEGDMEQSCLMGPAQVKIDSDCSSDKRKDGDLNGKVRNLKRKHEEETQSLSNSYLCTGLELYVTREPCIM